MEQRMCKGKSTHSDFFASDLHARATTWQEGARHQSLCNKPVCAHAWRVGTSCGKSFDTSCGTSCDECAQVVSCHKPVCRHDKHAHSQV